MKSTPYILLLFFMFFGIAQGYTQTANILEGCVPLEVDFSAPTGSTTFYWDFQDGASSIQQNPINVFINPGTYVVEFSEVVGGPVLGTVSIEVYAAPTPSITTDISTTGCDILNITFTGSSNAPSGVVITDYDWTFGDGFPGSGQTVSHVYNNAGYYDVGLELISSTPNCNVTLLEDSFILLSKISGNMFITPTASCDTPTVVNFVSNLSANPHPIVSYDWDFGNGTTSSDPAPPPISYNTIGATPISLTVTDSVGCVKTIVRQLDINPFSLDTFLMPDTVCTGVFFETINLEDNYSALLWSFAGSPYFTVGTNLDTSGAAYNNPGVYNVTLLISKNGCLKSFTRQITVIDPVLDYTITPDSVCSRDFNITLDIDGSILDSVKWYIEDTILLSEQFNENVNYSATFDSITWIADDSIIVVGYTKYGCVITNKIPFLYPPISHFVPSTITGTPPLTVNFYDTSYSFYEIDSWTIFYGDGTTDNLTSFDDTIAHTFNAPGLYSVCMVIENIVGCVDTSCFDILVGEKQKCNCNCDKTDNICVNDFVTLNYSSPDPNQLIRIWADDLTAFECPNDGGTLAFPFSHSVGQQDIEVAVYGYGSYSVDTVISVYIDGALAKFSYTQYCDSIYKVDFTDASQNATQVTYLFGDGNSSNLPNPTHHYANDGTYEVLQIALHDTSSCPPDTFRRTIEVREPVAAYSFLQQCEGDTIEVDASASSGLDINGCKRNYTWFNDGIPIRVEDPISKLFVDTGERELTLIVENAIGCKDTLTQNINIETLTIDVEIVDPIVCLPEEVIFDANLEGPNPITFQEWSFGNGITANTDSVAHTYSNPPTTGSSYQVVFQATDANNCFITDTSFVSLFDPQFSIVLDTFPNICLGDSIQFTAVGNQYADVAWDFDNGLTSNEQSFAILYDSEGVYNVQLSYTDTGNASCTDTIYRSIDVQNTPNIAITSSADGDSTFCFPLNIELLAIDSNVNTGSFFWTINGDNFFINPVSLTFDRGVNEVELIKTTNIGCTDTVTRIFNVVGPEADYIIDTNTICKGDEITFTITDSLEVDVFVWDFGDGITETNVSPVTHQYNFVPPNGQTVAKLSVFGTGMVCPYSIEKPIFLHEVYADFLRNNGDTSICFDTYTFENLSAGADSYEWQMGDGSMFFTEEVGDYDYAAPGEYEVSLYIENNQFGCTDSITQTVILYTVPEINAIGDTICEFDTAFVFVNNPDVANLTYVWSPTEFFAQDTGVTNQGVFSETTTLQVLGVDSNGCEDSVEVDIAVINIPDFEDIDTIVVQGTIVTLPLTQQLGYQYTWSPETGLSCLNCDNPTVQVVEQSTYNLAYVDTFLGCFEGTALYELDVHPETFVKIPNTFTPNGDGVNDVVYAVGWGIKELEYYRIYNRWGELVFETTDVNRGWDGYYKGKLQNDDIYQVKVKGFDFIGKELKTEGFLHLMQ